MGIQINGQTDTISSGDGSLSVTGAELPSVTNLNATGIVTATGFRGPLTGSVNSTGVSTISTLNATSITGVSTIGVTTVTATSLTVNGNNIASAGPLSNRNIIINGAMDINQRGWTGAAGTSTSGSYTTDRFAITHSHDGVVSAGQTSMNSTVGGDAFADGFRNALFFNVTTADASLAASQYAAIEYRNEGLNLQGIKKGTANALPITLSFWVRSTTTGTYIVELYDNDNTRQVSQAYTINSANTWEKKVLTFPADTTGAFDNDNALSLYVSWFLAAGSNYSSGTLNTSWASVTQANRIVGQTNLLGTINNNFFLTGVQLEVGSVATPFERRSYGQELMLCQRYYEKSFDMATAPADGAFSDHRVAIGCVFNGTQFETQYINFSVRKRAEPSVITFYRPSFISGTGVWAIYQNGTDWATRTMGAISASERGFKANATVSSGSNAQALMCSGHWSASAEL